MGADGHDDGRWIRPEEVPDPVALRKLRPPSVPPVEVVAVQGVTDPLPVGEPVEDPVSEPTDFTLEPPPLPARRVVATDELETSAETTEPRVVLNAPPRRPTPVAVWIAGTLLLVAALAVGGVMLGGSAEIRARAEVPESAVEPPVDARPTPVDQTPQAAAPVSETTAVVPAAAKPAPRRALRKQASRDQAPPTASVRAVPPPAVVRPRITPEPSASSESNATADAVNPWVELDR